MEYHKQWYSVRQTLKAAIYSFLLTWRAAGGPKPNNPLFLTLISREETDNRSYSSPLERQIKAATAINNIDLAFCPFYSDAGLNMSFFYSDAGWSVHPAELSVPPPDKTQRMARGRCCPSTSTRTRPAAALAPWGGLAGCYWSGSHTDSLSSVLL